MHLLFCWRCGNYHDYRRCNQKKKRNSNWTWKFRVSYCNGCRIAAIESPAVPLYPPIESWYIAASSATLEVAYSALVTLPSKPFRSTLSMTSSAAVTGVLNFNGSHRTDSSVTNDQPLDVNFSELLSRSDLYKFYLTIIYFKLVFNHPTSDGAVTAFHSVHCVALRRYRA